MFGAFDQIESDDVAKFRLSQFLEIHYLSESFPLDVLIKTQSWSGPVSLVTFVEY